MGILGPNINPFLAQRVKNSIPLWTHVIVGQMLSTGSATPNSLYEITSVTNYGDLFDIRSPLSMSIQEYKKSFPSGKLKVIPIIKNISGVAPTATRTFVGTSTGDVQKTYRFIKYSKPYVVSFNVGDTASVMADKVKAEIDLDSEAPFTVASAGGVLTFTSLTHGTLHNNALHMSEGDDIPGVVETFTAFAGGANDPVLTTSIFESVIGNERCNLYVPYYAFKTAVNYMDTKINVEGNTLSGFVLSCIRDTKANILNFTPTVYPKNKYASFIVDYLETLSTNVKGAGRIFFDNVDVLGSQLFAVLDKMIQPGENLIDNVPFTQAYKFDTTIDTLNRPTRDILFKNLTPNNPKYQLSALEQKEIRDKGYSSVKLYTDGNSVMTNDLISTDYEAQKLLGRDGVYSHLRSIRILQYVQGRIWVKAGEFLSDKNAGGSNSTSIKNVNFIIMKDFIYNELLALMPGGEFELLSSFGDRRPSDNASYEQIFNGEVLSEQGFSWSGSNGEYSMYIPIMIDGNLENINMTFFGQYIN